MKLMLIKNILLIAGITGKSKTSSTSKIRNTRATRKKRTEKGSRAENLGVNPHSNGLEVSRSSLAFRLKKNPNISKILARKKVKNNPLKKFTANEFKKILGPAKICFCGVLT